MNKKLKGAISVFMAIIYLWVFILEALLVDAGRMRLAQAEAEQAQQMANESIMTLYNQALYQYYDLFGETKYTPEQLRATVEEMMKVQLGAKSSGSYNNEQKISAVSILQGENYFDPFRFNTNITAIGSNINLGDESAFTSQISDSMKYKGPILLAQNFFDILGKMGSMDSTVKAVHDSSDKVEGVYKDYGNYCDEVDKLIEKIKKFTDDPTGKGKGSNMETYAKAVSDDIELQLATYMDSINDCSRQIFDLNVAPEGETEEAAAERAKKIKELQDKKDKIAEDAVEEVKKRGNEFLDNMNNIETAIGTEGGSGILKDLKDLEDKGSSYVGEGSNVVQSTLYLNDKENNVPTGDYSQDEKDIYKDFKKGVSNVKEKIKNTKDQIQKYKGRIKDDKFVNISPKYDEIKTYFDEEVTKSAKEIMRKYRAESVGYEMRQSADVTTFSPQETSGYKMSKVLFSGSVKSYVSKVDNLINYMKTPDYPLNYFYNDTNENRKKWDKRQGENFDSTKPNKDILEESPEGKRLYELSKDKSFKSQDFESSTHKLGIIEPRQMSGTEGKDSATEKIKKEKKSKEAKENNAKEISNMSNKVGETLSGGLDSLFQCAYVMSNFRDYVHVTKMNSNNITDKKYDSVMNTKFIDGVDQSSIYYLSAAQFKNIEVTCAEVEYVLYGFKDTKKDVAAVYADIYLKRLALDYVSVWLTPELRKIVMEAAAAAGPAAPAVFALMPLAFSVPRSLVDMECIMGAKKCPLIYTDVKDWVKLEWNDDNKLLCGYGDYLLLGLMLDGNKTKRMMNVVERNMKEIDKNFSLDKALVNMYVESECSIDHLFMSQAFIPTQFRQGTKHKFRIGTSFSY